MKKLTLNPDKKIIGAIREGLEKRGLHCPCKLQKTDENICICDEFRNQMADPEFVGYCHCRLYYWGDENGDSIGRRNRH